MVRLPTSRRMRKLPAWRREVYLERHRNALNEDGESTTGSDAESAPQPPLPGDDDGDNHDTAEHAHGGGPREGNADEAPDPVLLDVTTLAQRVKDGDMVMIPLQKEKDDFFAKPASQLREKPTTPSEATKKKKARSKAISIGALNELFPSSSPSTPQSSVIAPALPTVAAKAKKVSYAAAAGAGPPKPEPSNSNLAAARPTPSPTPGEAAAPPSTSFAPRISYAAMAQAQPLPNPATVARVVKKKPTPQSTPPSLPIATPDSPAESDSMLLSPVVGSSESNQNVNFTSALQRPPRVACVMAGEGNAGFSAAAGVSKASSPQQPHAVTFPQALAPLSGVKAADGEAGFALLRMPHAATPSSAPLGGEDDAALMSLLPPLTDPTEPYTPLTLEPLGSGSSLSGAAVPFGLRFLLSESNSTSSGANAGTSAGAWAHLVRPEWGLEVPDLYDDDWTAMEDELHALAEELCENDEETKAPASQSAEVCAESSGSDINERDTHVSRDTPSSPCSENTKPTTAASPGQTQSECGSSPGPQRSETDPEYRDATTQPTTTHPTPCAPATPSEAHTETNTEGGDEAGDGILKDEVYVAAAASSTSSTNGQASKARGQAFTSLAVACTDRVGFADVAKTWKDTADGHASTTGKTWGDVESKGWADFASNEYDDFFDADSKVGGVQKHDATQLFSMMAFGLSDLTDTSTTKSSTALQEQVAALTEQVSTLQSQLSTSSAHRASLVSRNKHLTTELFEAHKRVAALEAQVTALSSCLAGAVQGAGPWGVGPMSSMPNMGGMSSMPVGYGPPFQVPHGPQWPQPVKRSRKGQ